MSSLRPARGASWDRKTPQDKNDGAIGTACEAVMTCGGAGGGSGGRRPTEMRLGEPRNAPDEGTPLARLSPASPPLVTRPHLVPR
jgi:hypothetical protein